MARFLQNMPVYFLYCLRESGHVPIILCRLMGGEMSALALHGLRRWVKTGKSPLARMICHAWHGMRGFEVPVIPIMHPLLYTIHVCMRSATANFLRVFYWTPLFKGRLSAPAPRLYLFGGMPCILGPVKIRLGSRCRVAGMMTISGRSASKKAPELIVGHNCDIGWQSTIAVGSRVVLGNNVRIAGRAFLAGYPGHPLEAEARAKGLPDTDEQVGDIVLEDDVWLATNVSVMAGVRVGRGTVVAAGSVVTHDLPPGVLAAGSPARIIRRIEAA